MSDTPKNAPKGLMPLKGPMVVRHREAARFLWGDEKSGEVADVIYGRNEVIGTLIFKLKPGGYFRSSDTWKSFFDQDRFYFVLKGEIAVQDPETGESRWRRRARQSTGAARNGISAITSPPRNARCLTGMPRRSARPASPSSSSARTSRNSRRKSPAKANCWANGRHLPRPGREIHGEGGMITADGRARFASSMARTHPIMESLFVSTKELTAGTVDLMAGARSDNRSHPSDKLIFVTSGKLHVYLPATYDWFELDEWDLLHLPPGVDTNTGTTPTSR